MKINVQSRQRSIDTGLKQRFSTDRQPTILSGSAIFFKKLLYFNFKITRKEQKRNNHFRELIFPKNTSRVLRFCFLNR